MITHEELLRRMHYDPETGTFTWRKSGREVGNISRSGGCKYTTGEWRLRIDKKNYLRGRLAFFYMTGRWPIEVDHRDRDHLNDRWGNLREATRAQNNANVGVHPRNKFGLKGVSMLDGKYRAQIYRRGKKLHLGSFSTPEAAHAAYLEAARKFDGEFVWSSDTLTEKMPSFT